MEVEIKVLGLRKGVRDAKKAFRWLSWFSDSSARCYFDFLVSSVPEASLSASFNSQIPQIPAAEENFAKKTAVWLAESDNHCQSVECR